MNFLSHYYFERYATDSYHITGTVLPDLLKNADKTINIHPEKFDGHEQPHIDSLIKGWKRHLEVDRYFHNSNFFKHHSHQLKLAVKPAIDGSPVKPFFLGHIALELLLDNLLLTTGKINVDAFYKHLDAVNIEDLHNFLTYSHLQNTYIFFKFFTDFKKSRYLDTYADPSQVAYALKRICMRVWNNPFTAAHEHNLTQTITSYRQLLLPDFMTIFDDIVEQLD